MADSRNWNQRVYRAWVRLGLDTPEFPLPVRKAQLLSRAIRDIATTTELEAADQFDPWYLTDAIIALLVIGRYHDLDLEDLIEQAVIVVENKKKKEEFVPGSTAPTARDVLSGNF